MLFETPQALEFSVSGEGGLASRVGLTTSEAWGVRRTHDFLSSTSRDKSRNNENELAANWNSSVHSINPQPYGAQPCQGPVRARRLSKAEPPAPESGSDSVGCWGEGGVECPKRPPCCVSV